MGTRRYVIGKIAQAFLTLWFVLTFNFFLFRLLGDPSDILRGTAAYNPDNIEEVREEQGLDKPVVEQYVIYMKNVFTGNYGDSFFLQGQKVTEVVADHLWPTLLLVGTSTILSAIFGILIGIYGGWKRGSRFDVGSLGFTLFAYSMPEYWFGILVLMAFGSGVGFFPAIFPINGYETINAGYTGLAHVLDVAEHMAMPLFVLTIAYLGEYSLIMRSSLLDVMADDFVQTARAKGLREKKVLWRHVVPNALLPTFTIVVLSLGFIFAGAITVEYVFGWTGLGWLSVQAVDSKDLQLLQALFLLFSAAVIIANLIADLLYGYLDPRVRAR